MRTSRFNGEVPVLLQWDDHEVRNNWSPRGPRGRMRLQAKKSVAAGGARRPGVPRILPIRMTLREPERVYRSFGYGPLLEVFGLDMRNYRGANSNNPENEAGGGRGVSRRRAAGVAEARAARLAGHLEGHRGRHADRRSSLGRRRQEDGLEAVANGDAGARSAANSRSPTCSASSRRPGSRNIVWLTADVHYCAAHYYDPTAAVHGVRSVLGVRLRPAARRHLRPNRSTRPSAPR